MKTLILLATLWCWDDVGPVADGYRVYWGWSGTEWLGAYSVEVTRNAVDPLTRCPADEDGDGRLDCCTDLMDTIDPDPLPGEILYYVVTAFNDTDESDTGHGPVTP